MKKPVRKVKLHIDIKPEIKEKLKAEAERTYRSMAKMVEFLVDNHIEQDKKEAR